MTSLEQVELLYTDIHLPYTSGEGVFLSPGRIGNDNLVPCLYLSFFSHDGNRITHYFTLAGVYWTTITGHLLF